MVSLYEIDDVADLQLRNGHACEFIKFFKKSGLLLCWEDMGKKGGWNDHICRSIKPEEVANPEETLRRLEVWKHLPKKRQEALKEQKEVEELSHKRGRRPRSEYANLPYQLVCSCGKTVRTQPSQIVERAAKKNISPEEFIKQYRCQKCKPTKGKRK